MKSQPDACLQHGGNLGHAKATYGYSGQWIDLSTGINPVAYRARPLKDTVWQRLPDIELVTSLNVTAAAYFGAPDPAFLLAAPGTQSLLQTLPYSVTAKTVAVVSPTYNEHARCWARSGVEVTEIINLSQVPDNADIVVVVNPNNPDGITFPSHVLLDLASRLASRGGYLIVDEAFCDIRPELSLVSHAGRPGLVILRSFGKFFGLAGLRLGFALGPKAILASLASALGPWAVSGPALEIGAYAYADFQWIEETRKRLCVDSQRLRALLEKAGLRIVGFTDLFVLVELPEAQRLWHYLASRGVWTRPFDHNPNWLRLGLPAGNEEWSRLSRVIGKWAS